MNYTIIIQNLVIQILPVLFAITLHEVAHGWMAKKLGDRTAYNLGRITLNPSKHIDPIGTVVVPLAMYLTTSLAFNMANPILFGWARPVPVELRNLGNPRRDMALVALAGPGANLVMALFWAGIMSFCLAYGSDFKWVAVPLVYMGIAGVFINTILMVLNLLPILPLDGGRVVASLLPYKAAVAYTRLEPYGLIIVVAILVTDLSKVIVYPGVDLFLDFISGAFGLGRYF